jgi:hypothetical protein
MLNERRFRRSWLRSGLERFKATALRSWAFVIGTATAGTARKQEQQIEFAKSPLSAGALQIDFSDESRELKEIIKALSVGDRFRVFCDDGVLLLEKISQTQCKIIHSQVVAEFVH